MTCIVDLCIVFITLISVAAALTIVRLVKGPTAPDRAVAMDILTNITIVLLVILGFYFRRYIYLDVALVYGILAFVGVIALARYLEGGL
jgi:multicomponent Na+:H+ antiporter subunit F